MNCQPLAAGDAAAAAAAAAWKAATGAQVFNVAAVETLGRMSARCEPASALGMVAVSLFSAWCIAFSHYNMLGASANFDSKSITGGGSLAASLWPAGLVSFLAMYIFNLGGASADKKSAFAKLASAVTFLTLDRTISGKPVIGEGGLFASTTSIAMLLIQYIIGKMSTPNRNGGLREVGTAQVVGLAEMFFNNALCHNGVFDDCETAIKLPNKTPLYAVAACFGLGMVLPGVAFIFSACNRFLGFIQQIAGYIRAGVLHLWRGADAPPQGDNQDGNADGGQAAQAVQAAHGNGRGEQDQPRSQVEVSAQLVTAFAVQEFFKLLAISTGGMKIYSDVPYPALVRAIAIPSALKCVLYSSLTTLPIVAEWVFHEQRAVSKWIVGTLNFTASALLEVNELHMRIMKTVSRVCNGYGFSQLGLECVFDVFNVIILSATNGNFGFNGGDGFV
jgi:hypothetical protein